MPKTNEGALFRNDRRQTDKQPTHKGQANIDGKEYWIAAWVNESQQGQKYFALKYTPKDEAQGGQQQQGAADINEDDVPFSPEDNQ